MYEVYKVRLDKVHARTGYYNNEVFVFTFRVIEPDKQIRPIESWMERKRHPLSKVSCACRVLIGREFDVFIEAHSLLIGQECYVKVEGRKIIDFIAIADYETGKYNIQNREASLN